MNSRSRSAEIRQRASPMRSSTLLVALLVITVAAVAAPRPQGTPSRGLAKRLNIGRSYALLIGNQSYRHLTPLQTPIADVDSLGRVLEQEYGFEVERLLDADRAQMVDAFDSYVERLGEADRFLIYYAGHGHQDEATGEGYWLPVTARGNRRSEWVANNTVRDTLKAVRARHVLVIADSCFAGTLTRQAAVGLPVGITMDRYFEKLSNQKSRTALTSGGLEPVDDAGGGGHSVFAGALLASLQRSETPILEASKLASEIKRPVMLGSSGVQQPLFADIRQTGHQDGEFLFFRTRGGGLGSDTSAGPAVETLPEAQAPPVERPLDPVPEKGAPEKGLPNQSSAPSKGGYDDEPYTGKSVPDEPTITAGDTIDLVQTSERVREDWWNWEMHLEGPDWALDEVVRVVYHLHPSFQPPSVEVANRGSGFRLQRSGWGVFVVNVQIDYRDGSSEKRPHQLRFQ